jgi:hypothetical protein
MCEEKAYFCRRQDCLAYSSFRGESRTLTLSRELTAAAWAALIEPMLTAQHQVQTEQSPANLQHQ